MPDFGRWTGNGGDPSLNEINRTDRFLDALAYQQPVYSTDAGEAELANLLAGWRDEVRTPPLRAPVTPRDAVVALERAATTRRRTRTLAVVGSAAAAVLCLGGFVSVVAGAGPGDTLYGLHTMFFGAETPRNDSVMLASQQLAEVQQLVDQGQWAAAQDKLQTLTTTVATVDDVQQKQQFVHQWQELTVKVENQDPNATIPPNVPPPTFPEVPAATSDTATTTGTPPAPETSTATTPTSPSDTATTPTTPPSSDIPTTPSSNVPTTPSTPPPSATPSPTVSPSSPASTPRPTSSSPQPSPTAQPSQTSAVSVPRSTPTTAPPTAEAPLTTPTPTVVPTTREPVQQAPVRQEQSTPEAPAVTQVPTPKTAITTTVLVPEPKNGPS
jgi:hypothetical protein